MQIVDTAKKLFSGDLALWSETVRVHPGQKLLINWLGGYNVDISQLLAEAQDKGYMRNFALDGDRLHFNETDKRFTNDDCWIVDSQSVDGGTDPGDDATLYLIETHSGERGFIVVSDSFHADPAKAAFVDKLEQRLHST